MNLETLDMSGCRGNTKALETKVWAAIEKARAGETRVPGTVDLKEQIERLRAEANALAASADRLEDQVKVLREAAQRLFAEAQEIEARDEARREAAQGAEIPR